MEREEARRKAAYEAAVETATADWTTRFFNAKAGRDAILAGVEREEARRRAAYEAAVRIATADWTAQVQRANAERDAILVEVEREEGRRRDAYEAAVWNARAAWTAQVEKAQAERDAILAALEKEKARRLQLYQKSRRELEEAENEWRQTAARYEQSFDGLKRGLEQLKSEYLSLKPQYEQDYRQLEQNKEEGQRVQYLQTQFISDHKIAEIGDGRKADLLSNGIETAYDIDQDKILAIRGFGPKLTNKLLAWKEQVTRRFRFNAAAAVSPNDMAPLVVKYKQFQQRIEAKLQIGLTDLRGCAEKASRHLTQIYARIPGLVFALAQARVDAQMVGIDAP